MQDFICIHFYCLKQNNKMVYKSKFLNTKKKVLLLEKSSEFFTCVSDGVFFEAAIYSKKYVCSSCLFNQVQV